MIEELSYLLFSGKVGTHPTNHLELYNKTYRFWKNSWSAFWAAAGLDHRPQADDFLRQDVISVLVHADTVIATLFHTFFHLDQQLLLADHPYLQFFSPSFLDSLRARGVRSVMTFEAIIIDPRWRKAMTGISLAEVLLGCGTRVFSHSDADAAIGPARKDVHVHEMCFRHGFQSIESNVIRKNYPVELIACFHNTLCTHPNVQIQKIINHLWQQRQDFTGKTLVSRTKGARHDLPTL